MPRCCHAQGAHSVRLLCFHRHGAQCGTYKRELKVMVTFATKYAHMLHCPQTSTIWTDHKPLTGFLNAEAHEGIYAGWTTELMILDLRIACIEGERNTVADGLSRTIFGPDCGPSEATRQLLKELDTHEGEGPLWIWKDGKGDYEDTMNRLCRDEGSKRKRTAVVKRPPRRCIQCGPGVDAEEGSRRTWPLQWQDRLPETVQALLAPYDRGYRPLYQGLLPMRHVWSTQANSQPFKPSRILHPWEVIEADLMHMPEFEGHRYLLVAVDVFSRFVTRGIFDSSTPPIVFFHDPGTEFAMVYEWLKAIGCHVQAGITASKRLTGAVEAINKGLGRELERSSEWTVDSIDDNPLPASHEADIVQLGLQEGEVYDSCVDALVNMLEEGLESQDPGTGVLRVVSYLSKKHRIYRLVRQRDLQIKSCWADHSNKAVRNPTVFSKGDMVLIHNQNYQHAKSQQPT
ncbi:hypothetical protein AC579_10303 [Pseudocercospora musae]|uniref:Integrase catalytic domain-containing protein n=1 Tax=Pseudocercospora musae TaxID=113226 RepID=A0A139GWT4_9PEZI|nr:hypothetical protein AC579_10303 [Pseudocercospora musae]